MELKIWLSCSSLMSSNYTVRIMNQLYYSRLIKCVVFISTICSDKRLKHGSSLLARNRFLLSNFNDVDKVKHTFSPSKYTNHWEFEIAMGVSLLRISKKQTRKRPNLQIKTNVSSEKTALVRIYVRAQLHHIRTSLWFLVKIVQIIHFCPPVLRLPWSDVLMMVFRSKLHPQLQTLRWMRHIKSEEIARQHEFIFY